MKKITNNSNEKLFARLQSFCLLIALWIIGFSAQAQTTATFNTSGSFITPAGVTTATVEAWGAGGAGGGSTSNSDGGGGGGGGAYSKSTGVSVSGTIPVTVGIGGVGDTGAGNSGTDSAFNTNVVVAKGGVGGSVTSGTGGPGGAGGLLTSGTGTTKFTGGTGGRGRDSNTGQGGPGGSSAGTAANGNSGASTWSTVTAVAAPTGGGKGGDGGTSGNDGAAGTAPGGGGGGAGDQTNNGGSGAAGRVIVSYTCPTYALTAATTATGPFCAASASVVTLTSSSMPNGTYTVTYNLTGGNVATGSTASMTFASGSGTFTTSTLATSATPTTITVTGIASGTIGNGACVSTISTNNTVNVTVLAVVANAGTAFTKTCTANASGAVIGEATTAGYTYSWSPATGLSSSTISNPTANPATTTTYTVTKTNTATNCSAQASVTVTVNNTPPTAVAGADFTKTCTLNPTGKVIGETAVAGNTYSWSPATGLSSSTVANPTANPTVTTTYTVTKTTTATGCTATASITVTVDIATPTVSAGSAFTKTCVSNINGATIGEASVPGFTYSWSPTAGLSSSTISNPTANPTTTTTYTVTKTSTTNGCSATANVTVTVNNTLTVSAGADFTKTCTQNPSGKVIGETNVAGNTYSWSPATGLSNASVSNPTANPTVTTTYTVTKTNAASGCVATDDIIVTVNLTAPIADAGADFTKTCVTNPTGAGIGEATQSGHTYSWTPTTGLSSSTIANPTANPTTTTTYTVTKTNTASGCTDTDTVTVTVNTTVPTVAALTGTQTVCEGSTTSFSSTTNGGVWGTSNAAVATVSNGTVTGVAAGTTNINYTVTGANGCTTTVSRAVTVNPLPTSVVASGAATICNGSSTTLIGSAVISYPLITNISSDNFNGTPTYASAGTGSNIFIKKNSGFNTGSTTITPPDASSFMIAYVQAFFNTPTVTTTLTSPAINTSGYNSLTFSYNHAYSRGNTGTRTAVVEVSTDGGTSWTVVRTYTGANVGSGGAFVSHTINLDAYVNQANLKIRFNTTLTANVLSDGFWAIDSPLLQGSSTIIPLYSWTADTASGTNGLPSGSASPSTGNGSISVNPSATTNYTLVATDPITGCNTTSSSIEVFVKPLPTASAPSNETHCNGDSVAAVTLSGTPSGVTYDISGGASIGLADGTGLTQIPAYTATTGSATISVTPKFDGCTGAAVTYNVTVNPTPTVTAPADQNYCNGVAVSAMTLSGTPSGVTFDIAGGSAIGLSDVTGVTAIPAFTPALGSAVITLTPHANGCTGSAVTFNITVNPVLTPTFAPVASICAGTTISALPTTSLNGVTGSWSPALDNLNTTTYTFTPAPGQCVSATVVTLTIVVNTNTTYYADTDNDGYGDAASSVSTCLGLPTGYVKNNADCDDTNNQVYRTGTFYTDIDMDGYNNGMPAITICYGATVPSGLIAENNGTDCNDFDAEVNIWHVEVLGNGIDDNCDGNIDEVGPVTVIIPSICGSTLSHIANLIYVSTYGQATGYRFEVTNGSNVRLYDTDLNRMSLLSLPGGVTYGTTYTIRVSLQVNGFWQAYGAACTVTTPTNPATTNIVASMCGTTLASMGTTIYCNQVVSASHYRFELSDGVNAPVTVDSPLNRFNMAQLPGGPQYNTTYSVRVALRFGTTWQDYGDACNITTPATPGLTNLIASQCGITISNTWTTLYAQQVSDAQGYRFEVTNGATVRFFDTTANRFALRNLAGNILPNTVYTVRVAILFNGFYQPYGSACTVTTAGAITRQAAAPVAIFDVKTFPNPYADTFRIDVNTSSEETVEYKVYDMLGRQVEARKLSVSELGETTLGAQYPSGVYNIIVAQGENVKTLRVIKR